MYLKFYSILGEVQIFKRKVAHIVGVAEWSSFNLHVDESTVLLGFVDHPFPFLSWKSDTSGFPLFSPAYLSAGSEHGNLLGLNFPLEGIQQNLLSFNK